MQLCKNYANMNWREKYIFTRATLCSERKKIINKKIKNGFGKRRERSCKRQWRGLSRKVDESEKLKSCVVAVTGKERKKKIVVFIDPWIK